MIVLRPFSINDWPVLMKYQYPGIHKDEALNLISEFNKTSFQGSFQKFYAVDLDGQIVGYVSLIETESGIISIGAEIYEPFRKQGFAYSAITQLLDVSKSLGFHTATGQVRQDNIASLALCKKLGFSIVGEAVSRRNRPVYNLIKSI